MKTFRTTGTGNEQTLSEIETDKIPLYPTEQDLLDDLANLEVGQIAGTVDPAESELIGTLIQKIQELESKIKNNGIYSKDETLTGKTVIVNGVEKPIYRKYTQFMKDESFINGCSITNDQLSGVMPSDYDFIVTYELTCRGIEGSGYFWDILTGSRTYNKRINIYETNGKATTVYVNTGYYIYDGWFYIEYTKPSA